MLDIKLLRESPDKIKASELKRGNDPGNVDEVLKLDEKWKKELKSLEELKHKRNVVSQEINQAKKSGKNAASKIKEMKSVAAEIKRKEDKVNSLLEKRDQTLALIGNVLHPKVPEGKDDSENVELKTKGKKSELKFKIKNHVELAEDLGLADFDTSGKTSGTGFYFLKNELGLLNQAFLLSH